MAAILDVLAARFGTTAGHLWGVLQRQAYINAVMSTAALVAVAFGFRWVFRRMNAANDDEVWVIALVVAGLMTFVVTLFFLDAVGGALNPEFFALEQVLNAIKGGD